MVVCSLLNQIRYGLSPLRFHLFTYNIVENPLCPGCHDYIENSKHFFTECICYNQARVVMTTKLENILQSFGFNHDISDHDNLLFLFIYLFICLFHTNTLLRLCTQNRKFILIVNFSIHLLNVLHTPIYMQSYVCIYIYIYNYTHKTQIISLYITLRGIFHRSQELK